MKDPDVVARLKGVILTSGNMLGVDPELEMGDAIAVRTPLGLVTVASVTGREARTIERSTPSMLRPERDIRMSRRFESSYGQTYKNPNGLYQRNR
jgi:hypothetical protein